MVPSSSGPSPSSKEVEAWVSRIDEIHEAVSELLSSDPADDLARVEAREQHRKEWLAQQEKARLEIIKMRYEPKYYGRYEKDEFIEEQLKKVDEDRGPASELQRKHKNDELQDSTLFSKAERISLEEAYRLKEEGSVHVRKGEWEAALKAYDGALKLGIDEMDPPLSVVIHNNRALVRNKIGCYLEVWDDTTYVLQREPSNVKALLRRATALRFLHRPMEALKDVAKALRLEPTNGEGLRLRAWLHRAEGEIFLSDRFVEEAGQNTSLASAAVALAECLPRITTQPTTVDHQTVDEKSPATVLQRVATFLRAASVEEVLRHTSVLEKTLRMVEEGGIGAAVWFGLQGGVASILSLTTQFLQQLKTCTPTAVSVASVEGKKGRRSPADVETRKGNMPSSSSCDEKQRDASSACFSTVVREEPRPMMASSAQMGERGGSSFVSSDSAVHENPSPSNMESIAIPLVHCLHLLSVLFEGCETVSQDASDQSMQSLFDHLIPFVFPAFFTARRMHASDAMWTNVFHASLECLTSLYPPYGDRIHPLLEALQDDCTLPSVWAVISSAGKKDERQTWGECVDSSRHFLTILLFLRFLTACLASLGGAIDLQREVSSKVNEGDVKTEGEGEKPQKEGSLSPVDHAASLPRSAKKKLVHQLFFDPDAPILSRGVSDEPFLHSSSEMIMEVVAYCLQKNMPMPIQSAGVSLALRRSSIQVFVLPHSSSSQSGTRPTLTQSDHDHLKKVVPLQWMHQRWTSMLCAVFSGVLMQCSPALSSSASLSTELHFLEAFYALVYNLCLSAPDRQAFVQHWEHLCGSPTLTQRTWDYVCTAVQSTTNAHTSGDRSADAQAKRFLYSPVLPKMLGVLAKFVPFLPELQASMSSRRMASPVVSASNSGTSPGTMSPSAAVRTVHPSVTDGMCPLWIMLHALAISHRNECTVEKETMHDVELLEHLSTVLAVLVRSQQSHFSSSVRHEQSDTPNSQGPMVVRGPFYPANMRDLLTLLAVSLPPSEEGVLQWKEMHSEGKSTGFSSRTSHLSMPLVTLGNVAILIAMVMDIAAVLAQHSNAVLDAKDASTPLKDYQVLLTVLKEKDAVGTLLHSIRGTRTSLLMLARERADAEKKNTGCVLASLRSWEEHCSAAQKNLGIAISKVVMGFDDMRARLRELNGLETLAAVVR